MSNISYVSYASYICMSNSNYLSYYLLFIYYYLFIYLFIIVMCYKELGREAFFSQICFYVNSWLFFF